jgi:GntR family transcriptional regulator, arabinose operon transcriptional repressor
MRSLNRSIPWVDSANTAISRRKGVRLDQLTLWTICCIIATLSHLGLKWFRISVELCRVKPVTELIAYQSQVMIKEMPKVEAVKLGADLSEHAVAAILEERIKSGVYGPGARIPSERALADELGASRRFIRMAFELLVKRGIMEKSHYRRPFVSLRSDAKAEISFSNGLDPSQQTSNQTIAAILPSHPMFPGGLSIVAGIHKALAQSESPYRLTFIDTFHEVRSEVLRIETNAIKSLSQNGANGVIWWSYSEDQQIEEVIRQNADVPIVFIDRHPNSVDSDFVGIDDVESSRMAVEYLFSLNHKRIAHLMDPGDYSTILERAEGYRQAHISHGIPACDDLIYHLGWSKNRIQEAFDHLYSLDSPPTALFTSNDFIAYEFIDHAETNGIRIPDDLSVIGHGNIDRYAAREFLTSVDQPFEQIGKAAAKLLLKRLASQSAASRSYQHIIMPAPLVPRRSSSRLAG